MRKNAVKLLMMNANNADNNPRCPEDLHNSHRLSGFTLIEVLIYSALLAIFIGAAMTFVSSILGSTDAILERNEIIGNQEFIERKIRWLVLNATQATLPLPNSSSSELQLNIASSTLSPAFFSLATSSAKLQLKLGSGSTLPITNGRVRVANFWVEHFSNNQSTSTLKISLDIESALFSDVKSSSTFFYVIPQ
jgi:type II secretory pathway pseudopilin PulG